MAKSDGSEPKSMVNIQDNGQQELVKVMKALSNISTDSYSMCKYTLQAVSGKQQEEKDFINELFRLTDNHRPLLIGMKKTD